MHDNFQRGHKYPGVFISFEGGEGVGKTTHISLLQKYLESQGHEVVSTREPGGTIIGEKARSLILDPENKGMGVRAELFLFQASRAQLVDELIRPSLEEGKVVLTDRFYDSTFVYQGLAGGMDMDDVRHAVRIAVDGVHPDLTFLLDGSTEASQVDGGEFGEGGDRMEQKGGDFHTNVYDRFRAHADAYGHKIKIIPYRSGAIDEMQGEVMGVVDRYLLFKERLESLSS